MGLCNSCSIRACLVKIGIAVHLYLYIIFALLYTLYINLHKIFYFYCRFNSMKSRKMRGKQNHTLHTKWGENICWELIYASGLHLTQNEIFLLYFISLIYICRHQDSVAEANSKLAKALVQTVKNKMISKQMIITWNGIFFYSNLKIRFDNRIYVHSTIHTDKSQIW